MSALSSAADIAVGALEECGLKSPFDAEPTPEHVEIALRYLDALVAHLAGVHELPWLMPWQWRFTLAAGQAIYDLDSVAAPPPQFVSRAERVAAGTTRGIAIDIVEKHRFEALPTSESGSVTAIWIARTETRTERLVRVHPAPPINATVLDDIVLYGQAYAADLTEAGGQVPTAFPTAWTRFLRVALAIEIGSGALTTLPLPEIGAKQQRASAMLAELLARNRRENDDRPKFARPYDPHGVDPAGGWTRGRYRT